MKYEVICGPIALDATTTAQTGDVIILDESDGKALVQYQILKVAAEDAIAINEPVVEIPPVEEPVETAAQKKKRLADEEAAAKAAAPPAPEVAKTAPAATPPAA
jgi:hypothetical protein